MSCANILSYLPLNPSEFNQKSCLIPVSEVFVDLLAGEQNSPSTLTQFTRHFLYLKMTSVCSFEKAWQTISMDDMRRGHAFDMEVASGFGSHREKAC